MYGIQFGFKCICSVSGADFLFQFLKDASTFHLFHFSLFSILFQFQELKKISY